MNASLATDETDSAGAVMTGGRLADFFAACNARDIDAVASFFAPEAFYHGSRGPADDGVTYAGLDQVRAGMDTFLNGHSELAYTDLVIDVLGSTGFATWTFTGTKNGRRYSYRGVDVLRFAGDRILVKDAFRKERAL